MRLILVLAVLALIAFVGYEYVYKQQPPPRTVEEATEQARRAAGEAVSKAQEALSAATQAVGPAAEQAGQALREGAEQLRQGAEQLGQQAGELAGQAAQTTQEAAADARSLVVDGVDLGTQMQEAAGRARAALAGVTDAATAQAQLPTLQEVNAKLDELQGRLGGLPAEAQRGFAAIVSQTLPSVRATAERIKAIEGTGPEVDGALDALVAKLEAWSRPPA